MSTLRANELKKLDDTNWVGTNPTQVPTNYMIGEQGFEQAVDSVAALRLATFPASLERLWLSGYYGVGTAGGGPLYRKGSGFVESDENGILFVDADGVGWEAGPGFVLAEDATITVPSRFATLQDAIDGCSHYHVAQGVTIGLLIESGHQPVSGIAVKDGDYGHFVVRSDDLEVSLPTGFGVDNDFIYADHARFPTLDCLVDAGVNCRHGVNAENQSSGVITNGSGVKNVAQSGLRAYNQAAVSAVGSVFSGASQGDGATQAGIVSWSSNVDAELADTSNSGYYGAQAAASGTLNFRGGIADNAVRHGIRATNGALVNARSASAQNCAATGMRAFDGSIVHAQNSNVNGSDVGFWAQHSSSLNARGATANNTEGLAVFADDGSTIDFSDGSATGLTSTVISSINGSTIAANSCTVSTTVGSCFRTVSGNIYASNSSATTTSTESLSAVCRSEFGGEVICENATLDAGTSASVIISRSATATINNSTLSFSVTTPITHLDGAFVNVKNTGITDDQINGTLNTLGARGIVFG